MDLSQAAPARRTQWSQVGVIALTILAGALVGLVAIRVGFPVAAAVAVAPALAVVLLRSVWSGFIAVIAVACILPFGVLPLGGPITPTLLELALIYCLLAGSAVALLDRRQRLHVGWSEALVLVLIGIATVAFLLGIGRGYTSQTAHDFGRFLLAIGMFWLTREIIRSPRDGRLLLHILLAGSTFAGLIGLALFAGGPGLTMRVLGRLVAYGYPSDEIVRFIESNPALSMRAIGTGVDPNAFGGLMMVGLLLAASQLLSAKRSVSVWVSGPAAGVTALALLLSYSRGAWVGAALGIGFVLVLRRRWLIAPLGVVGLFGIAFGLGSGFITRLWEGFTLQDPATKLRLQEYQNAWNIIREHPWIGVGFGDAPSNHLQTGVSSVYLLIAERIGLVGLAVFLAIAAVIAWRAVRVVLARKGRDGDVTLSFATVFLALLAVAVVDHYLFNPEFSHMVALFWIVAGALVALCISDSAERDVGKYPLPEDV
ncbi:MAG: O-antigen ligase family protein [Thermomicrobiales bacterium]|nr:O-antigen ligase family protein [Thermomicrobiales bacterium]